MGLPEFSEIDLTLIILTFARARCLPLQLQKLAAQTYAGKWEIILWNNNPSIADEVQAAARAIENVPLTCITTSTNYLGRARFAAAELARGRLLMFCDDDILPGERFIERFVWSYDTYGPRVVLCGSAHRFIDAVGDKKPTSRRLDLDDPFDADIHYAHGSNLLTSLDLFRQAAKVAVPRPEYFLIDDLWLSFVWTSYLGVRLLKIRSDATWHSSWSDPAVALHRNPAVRAELESFVQGREWGRPKQPIGGGL